MSWFIGTARGFVESIQVINNRYRIDFTPDVRKALTFTHFADGEKAIYKAQSALPKIAPYFALVCSVAQAAAASAVTF